MAKSLAMVFTTETGKKATLTVSNVKDGVTNAEVAAVMNTIIGKNIFNSNSGDLKLIDSASILDKTITELAVK